MAIRVTSSVFGSIRHSARSRDVVAQTLPPSLAVMVSQDERVMGATLLEQSRRSLDVGEQERRRRKRCR